MAVKCNTTPSEYEVVFEVFDLSHFTTGSNAENYNSVDQEMETVGLPGQLG